MVKLELRGLTCANCAAKIEHQVKELPEVKDGTLDLMNQKIHIDLNKSNDAESVIGKTREIVQLLEPHVEVIPMEGGSSFKKEEKTAFFTAVKDYTKENPFVVIGFGLFLFAVLLQMPRNIEIAVYMLAYILVGGKVVLTAAKNILKGQVFDEHFLMAIATVGALLLGEFPEAVAVMVFWQIGEAFQDYAVNNSRKNIKGLLDLKAEFANLVTPEGLQKVDPAIVKVGDIVTIKPGEKVPLDGIVIKGSAKMDTSSLTGESVPRGVNVDDKVLSGYINTDSVIDVEVTKLLAESTAARILDLVENASAKKSRTEQFITRFARYYTPVVVILAALLAFVAPLIIPGANFAEWVERALIFLVVSCPCGLVISIPLGFFGGIGAASNHGILVKGGNYLETLNSVTHVVFDKTGTLTKGVFKVTDTHIVNGMDEEAFLKVAASVELHSNHPIAKSIRNAYGKHIDESTISDFKEISGQGITALVEGIPVSVGNATLMKSQSINYKTPDTVGTVVHVTVNKVYAGYMIIADEIKNGVMDLTKQLHKAGIKKAIMLTGDHTSIAQEITNKLGLDDFRAELLPGDKVDEFERIKNSVGKKERVAFVGDGINDAPVLARADIGISMGGVGSDAAIEASDVVLMTDEPKKIAEAKLIANKTKVIVWQNIIFALGIKVAVLLLATLGMTNMWMAIFADVGVALLAILNASRVLKTNVEFK